MEINDNVHHHEHCMPYKRLSWSAILAGALVGTGLGFLLHLYGLAIGLQAFSSSPDGTSAIAVGGLAGMVIGVIIAMFLTGYTAGYLGRHYCPMRNLGIVYGFVTWTVALIIGAVLVHHAGEYTAAYKNIAAHSQVVVDNNAPVAANTSTTNKNVVVTTEAPATKNNVITDANVKPMISLDSLTWAAYVIFGMFFIGAFFSCVGACCGMSCKRQD